MDHATERKPRPSRPVALFRPLCPERSLMVALISGSAAWVAGADRTRSLWMALAAWCLALTALGWPPSLLTWILILAILLRPALHMFETPQALVFVVVGLVCAYVCMARPSPQRATILL